MVPISVCGVFSVAAELCILSSCWGWGRLLLSLFWCDCSAFFLGHLRFSAMYHAAGYPSGVPHLADSGWLTSSCSGALAWGLGCLGTDVLLPHLVFSLVPCSSSGPCSLRRFPSCRFPWGFPVTGCLSFCFPGDVGWASALPFFFCASPAPLSCRVMHPVSGCSSCGGICLVCR